MHVKRFEDAEPYEAPNHRAVVGLRLLFPVSNHETYRGNCLRRISGTS